MFLKSCVCGKTSKNFKFDIGPFFVTDCCEEAGYDCKGVLKEPKVEEKQQVTEPAPEPAPVAKRSKKKKKAKKKKVSANKT